MHDSARNAGPARRAPPTVASVRSCKEPPPAKQLKSYIASGKFPLGWGRVFTQRHEGAKEREQKKRCVPAKAGTQTGPLPSQGYNGCMAIKLHSTFAVHPGPWLKRNVIDHFALSVPDAADHLDVSRQSMSKLLNGRQGLTAEMAIRFEKAFGLKADTLLRMQSAHELAEARAREDEIEVEAVAD